MATNAPGTCTLAEIVAEGRRLEAERDTPFRQTEPGSELERIVLSYRERKQHLLDVHYTMHGPALLAVAEAAVEWEAADAARYSYCTIEDRKRVDDRWMAARAALRAAASPAPGSEGVREAVSENDVYTLIGHAEYLRKVRGEEDMPKFFDGLARRLLAALRGGQKGGGR